MKHTFYKEKILLLLFTPLSLYGFAQKTPIAKLYAYAQLVTPGARPQGAITENGKEQPAKPTERVSYFFYAEQLRSTVAVFTTVWIKGRAYAVRADTVTSPAEMITGEATGQKKIELAPATKHKLWLISPAAENKKPPKPGAVLQKLINKNELVLVYRWKNKLYYYPVKKLKMLPSVLAV